MNQQDAVSNTRGKLSHPLYLVASVLAVTALTYAGTLRFDFVSDDNPQIADNPFIKSWRFAPHFFASSVWVRLLRASPHSDYRPLYLFWNLLNDSLFGLRPLDWHITAVLLHLVVTALVYLLIRKLVPDRPNLSWLTALIFGVHPIHHEVVAWVSGASESLYAAFFLGSFLAYCNARTRDRIAANGIADQIASEQIAHNQIGPKQIAGNQIARTQIAPKQMAWMFLSCLLYGLAMFANETAIVLPALVFAHFWLAARKADPAPSRASGATFRSPQRTPLLRAMGWSRLRQAAGIALVYAPILAIYLLMRFRALSAFGRVRIPMSFADLLFTWPSVLLFYLKHWFLPFSYSAYYDVAYYRAINLTGVVLPTLLLLAFAGALWLAKRPLGAREVGFAVMWMIVPLLPMLDLGVFPHGELAHDRYFYVPSIGAALLIALLLEAVATGGSLVWGQPSERLSAALLLIAVLSFSAAMTANQWANDLALLTRARQFAPRNLAVREGLGVEWTSQGRLDDAQAMLKSLVEEAPQDSTAWLNLARVRYQKQNYAEAEADLRRTIALDPNSAFAYILLGQAELKTDTLQTALLNIHQGVQLLPDEYRFHVIYGVLLQANGDCHDAMTQFTAALVLHPGEGISERGLFLCRAANTPSPVANASPLPR